MPASVAERPRPAPGWFQRARALPPVVQDTALAAVLAATLVFDLARQDVPPGSPIRPADPLGYVLVALLVLPLALRRRHPVGVFTMILVDAVVVVLFFYRPTSFGFGLIIATYTVARWCEPRASVIALLFAQAFGVFVKLRAIGLGLDIGWFNWPIDVVYFAGAWFLGYSIRTQNQYATALEHSREALARRAVDDERTRIARELHDAVGHSLSVMLIHAGAAEGAIGTSPERAKRALDSVDMVGRAALTEMDDFLGLLREDDRESNPILRPSLANLDSLIEEFRELGLEVGTTIAGTVVPLPPTVDQAAFRIVQEALTNTLKHAGPTRADVEVTFSANELMVRVRDHGPRSAHHRPVPSTPHSQGLIGMRERTAVLRGELHAGPCDDQGFVVVARIPLNRSVSR